MAYFIGKPTRDDELKATTPLLIGQSTTLAKGMLDTRKMQVTPSHPNTLFPYFFCSCNSPSFQLAQIIVWLTFGG